MGHQTSQDVLEHHLDALRNGDIDEVMADYADDACMLSAFGVAEGADAIRGLFGAIPGDFWEGFTVEARECAGEIAYVVWKTDAVPLGSDTLVVRDGRIVAQTVVMQTG